ncbi:hypothetical protein [Sideroxydans lithotrophicus]|uniref:Uncharacterized protein n=1 Tax=Sideroxydans lithotrophicus (strain ES-1) TaxID=580332 RepID=D5CNP0_SIDLE|nr:hypothetical protein [Sideroxydans lithotrophicus]ADE10953.1 hypothetical protein Slit_0714 [Sideroxydans lithotrophicus ES-1]
MESRIFAALSSAQMAGMRKLTHVLDALRYRGACSEMPVIHAKGELKRIDRLAELDDEVWGDCKLDDSEDGSYRTQIR